MLVERPAPRKPPAGAGVTLQAGGGIADFSRSELQMVSEAGGYWDVRAVFGSRRYVGVEAAYVGVAHPLASLDPMGGATLMGHGAEGSLRFAVPLFVDSKAFFTPFAFAGLGWTHYRVEGSPAGLMRTGVADDVAHVPLGGGLALGHGHLFLETRFSYRFTFMEDVVDENPQGREKLNTWMLGGNFGYVF